MALHWDFNGVKDLDELIEEFEGFENLAWISLAIGMNKITSSNYMEFYARYRTMEQVFEPYFGERKERYIYTPKFIKRCIGFKTNASTKTKTEWAKYLFNKTLENIEREYKSNEESIEYISPL